MPNPPRTHPSPSRKADRDVGFIGVGALATALAQALARVWPPHRLHLSPRGEAPSRALEQQYDAVRHPDNQAVLDACRIVVVGVRPAQLPALAGELQLTGQHHLVIPSAGTPLARLQALFAPARVTRAMTGLAVAGGHSAVSIYPGSQEAADFFAPACASVVAFNDEAQFDASIVAVCANAWWIEQLATLTEWMVRTTGMSQEQAQALLSANMADVATMARLRPQTPLRALAREIGTRGTFTASGLDHLHRSGAHQRWEDACALVLQGMRNPDPAA